VFPSRSQCSGIVAKVMYYKNTDCSDDKVISSSVLTYTGNINDDGKILYCTAVNIEEEGWIISSNKTILIWCKY
jgi:hypothetical protein